jgi:hypothetical protein
MNKKLIIAVPALFAMYFLYKKTQANNTGTVSSASAINSIGSNSVLSTILNKVGSVTTSTSGKRGIRNNNPGNIRLGSAWQGMREEQTDGSFVQFVDPKYGIRAMARIIDNYKKRGVKTISQIISTWAPSNENNTASYIDSVAKKTGWPSFYIPDKSRGDYLPLIKAIIYHENGEQPYSDAVINEGIGLA